MNAGLTTVIISPASLRKPLESLPKHTGKIINMGNNKIGPPHREALFNVFQRHANSSKGDHYHATDRTFYFPSYWL